MNMWVSNILILNLSVPFSSVFLSVRLFSYPSPAEWDIDNYIIWFGIGPVSSFLSIIF